MSVLAEGNLVVIPPQYYLAKVYRELINEKSGSNLSPVYEHDDWDTLIDIYRAILSVILRNEAAEAHDSDDDDQTIGDESDEDFVPGKRYRWELAMKSLPRRVRRRCVD